MTFELVGLVALLAGMPAIILFVGFYGTRSHWRKYPAGRALMYMTASLALVYLWVALRLGLALAGHPQEDTVPWKLARIVLFGGVSVAQWRLLFTLLRIQRHPTKTGWMIDRPGKDDSA